MRKRRNSKKVRSLPFFDEKYLKVRKRIVADDKLKRIFIGEKKRKIGKFEERQFIAIRK